MKRIIAVVVVILLIIFLVIFIALREAKAPTETQKPAAGPQNQSSSTFHGPTGPPQIIGPSGPPPKY